MVVRVSGNSCLWSWVCLAMSSRCSSLVRVVPLGRRYACLIRILLLMTIVLFSATTAKHVSPRRLWGGSLVRHLLSCLLSIRDHLFLMLVRVKSDLLPFRRLLLLDVIVFIIVPLTVNSTKRCQRLLILEIQPTDTTSVCLSIALMIVWAHNICEPSRWAALLQVDIHSRVI
jgi:hypothetical protein